MHATGEAHEAFLAAYPGYARTGILDELRRTEYSAARRTTYLDYTGAGLAADAQIRQHAARLLAGCFGNPHSEHRASRSSTELVERARDAVLAHFHADPDEYAAIFTANASTACRLVGESYPFGPEKSFVLTFDNHNSVNGIREFARAHGASIRYVPPAPEFRVADDDVRAALASPGGGLFAFPAQSNFSGVQHPLEWVELAHASGFDVLVDSAAYVPTNALDLRTVSADFVPVSWYKVFGYPTGVGCLVARRSALAKLHRPWFAGGTIKAASVLGDWFDLADDESAFEDGTLNFLAVPDVEFGLSWINAIGVELIHERVQCLTGWVLERLAALRHRNGAPLIRTYGPSNTWRRGGIIAFNVLDPHGRVLDERLVSRDSLRAGLSVRTGCFCNPGAAEDALQLTPAMMRAAHLGRVGTLDEYVELLGLPSAGAIRASFGVASDLADAERLLGFLRTTYLDRVPVSADLAPRDRC